MSKPDCAKCRKENHDDFLHSIFARCNDCEPMKKYKAYLENKRLFIEGAAILSVVELLEQEWVLVNGRGKHIKAILNMQLGTVLRWLQTSTFKIAIRKEHPDEHRFPNPQP